MDLRRDELEQWAIAQIRQHADLEVTTKMEIVSGDASFRRYFRLYALGRSWIAVDAPTDKEDNPRFVSIDKLWYEHGINVPKVIAHDFEQGFMLLEDFGDQLLWHVVHAKNTSLKEVENYYRRSVDELMKIQALPTENLPSYSAELLLTEMQLFVDWLAVKLLKMDLSEAEHKLLSDTFNLLRDRALAQPQVPVHRDYHSRNIMLCPDGRLGVIDFQDAVKGPVTYDLVSLLRGCYVRWPAQLVDELAASYWEYARPRAIYLNDFAEFKIDFDWMGLQRHLKAAGIFARLHLRDGKSTYLADIPNTCQYLLEQSAPYEEFAEFNQWLQERFMPALENLPKAKKRKTAERDSSVE